MADAGWMSRIETLIRQLQGKVVALEGQMDGLRIVRGLVSSAGVASGGSGYTITKGVTGVFTVNFDPVFSSAPSVTAIANNSVGAVGYASITASAAVLVTFVNGTTASDQGFSFIAVGPV